jgi:hypothetical protein
VNKTLLALTLLAVGAGGFLKTREATLQLTRVARANQEAWRSQTRQLARLQGDSADLMKRLNELKAGLAHFEPVTENPLWSFLQTNRTDRVPGELAGSLPRELGFNWQASPDYIIVTKDAFRDLRLKMLNTVEVSEMVALLLSFTPEERSRVDATLGSARTNFNEWARAHVERREPKGDVVASYFLPPNPDLVDKLRADLADGFLAAVGPERADMLQYSLRFWVEENIGLGRTGATLIVRRVLVENEPRFQAVEEAYGVGANGIRSGYLPGFGVPANFGPIFPNGWADVAQLEGVELPDETPAK